MTVKYITVKGPDRLARKPYRQKTGCARKNCHKAARKRLFSFFGGADHRLPFYCSGNEMS